MPTRQRKFVTLAWIGIVVAGCGTKDTSTPGTFIPTNITLKEVDFNRKELVDESLTFIDSNGAKWIAPHGTWTDGASVPRLALPITDGRFANEFLKAAVVHDAYCQEDNEKRCPEQYRKKPCKAVHRMFYEACIAGGTPPLKAKVMFAAVWLAGPRWDDPARDLQDVSAEALTRGFAGCKEWIERDDPTTEAIEADIDRRTPLLLELYELESTILAALGEGETAKAAEGVQREEAILKDALAESPNDIMLLNFKGYLSKNRALLYRASNSDDKANEEISSAARTFETVIKIAPEDPSALNGLGSVSILRGDLDQAEKYVRRALAIAPDYQAAKDDLELVQELQESQPP